MRGAELWIIYALAFGAVLLGVQGAYWFFFRTRPEKKAINRRIALGQRLESPVEVLNTLQRERGLGLAGETRILAGLELLVLQTGLRVDPVRLLLLASVAAGVLFLCFGLVLGIGLIALALAVTI